MVGSVQGVELGLYAAMISLTQTVREHTVHGT